MVLRTQVPDLNNFVGAILQAEQLGVSVTKVLTVQAEQMRVLRRQRAEEKAAQLQLKLIFPLAIFIFPALCVVIMGPIWPTHRQHQRARASDTLHDHAHQVGEAALLSWGSTHARFLE